MRFKSSGFSIATACEAPGTTAHSEFGIARNSAAECAMEMRSSSPMINRVGAEIRPRSSMAMCGSRCSFL